MTESEYDRGYAQAFKDMEKFATSIRKRREFSESVARGEQIDTSQDNPIHSRVRAIRESKRLTQTEVAEAMQEAGFDFHQQTVYKIESGRRRLLAEEVAALADALEVEPSALI